MNDKILNSNLMGTATVVLLAFLLFYFPTVFNILSDRDAPPGMLQVNLTMSTTYTFLFCINYFWVIPRFVFGGRGIAWFYILNGCIMLLALGILPVWFDYSGVLPAPGQKEPMATDHSFGRMLMHYTRFALRDSVMMVLSVGLAYALRLSREREKFKRRELELDAERRSLELRSLKMQLNPHFLFNSLNNIYSLIAISPEKAQEALHDLSGMLRYMIYDASVAGVPLSKEVEFIEDLTRLSSLRLGTNSELLTEIDKSGLEGLTIAPLLLVTLVENAFTHFAPAGEKGYIRIFIKCDADWIVCRVENSCAPEDTPKSSANKKGGVGLSNIERQLALIYPGDFTFDQEHSQMSHTAVLRLRRDALLA